jgi:hypothetical protein
MEERVLRDGEALIAIITKEFLEDNEALLNKIFESKLCQLILFATAHVVVTEVEEELSNLLLELDGLILNDFLILIS